MTGRPPLVHRVLGRTVVAVLHWLLVRLGRRLQVVESVRVAAEPHAWEVAVLRPGR